tara:strand:- start:485 stop:1180 length:696 start_codon:yes stop_codon:yes gene_type:complete
MSDKGRSSRLSSSHRISHPSRYIFIANIGSIIRYISNSNINIDKLIDSPVADDINEYISFVQILVKIINRYFYIENTNKTINKTINKNITRRKPPQRRTLKQRRTKQNNRGTRLESTTNEMRSLIKDLEDKKIDIDIISNKFLRDFYNRLKSYGIYNIDNKRDLGDKIKKYIFGHINTIIEENNRLINDIANGELQNYELFKHDSFKTFYKAYKMYLVQKKADNYLLDNCK